MPQTRHCSAAAGWTGRSIARPGRSSSPSAARSAAARPATRRSRRATGFRRRAGSPPPGRGGAGRGGGRGEPELLAACYRKSLALAARHGLKTIAFPAISCGVFGYPLNEAATIAVRECTEFLGAHPDFERITFALFDAEALETYRRLLGG